MNDDTLVAARKALILRMGQEAVARRGARRRARRHAVVMVALTAGATIASYTLAPTSLHGPTPGLVDAPEPASTIVRVATTRGLAGMLRVAPDGSTVARIDASPIRVTRVETTPAAERIGDAEALALLREAGTPAGLIKIDGHVLLVYHERPEGGVPGPSGRSGPGPERPRLATLPVARTYRPL